ncbi:MAG: gamma-glutamylcyclotransferase [Terriglobia bacterium]
MSRRSEKLFVYGTLRRGFPLHAYLDKKVARYLGKGKICGRLYDLGQFPGAIPSQSPTDEIEGELYELIDASKQLSELDAVEEFDPDRPGKSLFVRQLAEVELETGQKLNAWVYFLPGKPTSGRLVQSGDYAQSRRPSK